MRGAASQIAEIAGVSRAHVSRVLNLKKPPSIKILLAIDCVLSGAKRRINGAILHRAHPEIDPESQIPNSEERAGGRA
jgi:transcriptional regulator with XRE-family HTH domain